MVEVVVKVVVVVVVVVGSGTAGYPDFEDVGAARFLWLDGACRGLPRQLWHAGASVACGGLIDRTSGRNACVTYHSLWDSITGSAYLPHKGGRRVDDTLAVKGVERGRGVRGRVGVSPHPTLTYVRTDASPQPSPTYVRTRAPNPRSSPQHHNCKPALSTHQRRRLHTPKGGRF